MTTVNPATQPQDKLNGFTQQFAYLTEGWSTRTDELWVQLRNGTLVRPVFKAAEDQYCEDTFQYHGDKMSYCWNLDGTSVTRPNYDMMEIVRID